MSIRASRRWGPAARTTSCAPRSSRWCSTCPPTRPSTTQRPGWRSCTSPTALTTRRTTTGMRVPDSPGIRGADPAIVLIPGVGMFSYGKDKQTARVAGRVLPQRHQRHARRRGDLHLRPHRRSREVPHRILGAGRGQAGSDAQAQAAGHPHRSGHWRRLRYRQGHRHPAGRRGGLRGDRRPRRRKGRCRSRRDRQHRCRRRDCRRRHR